MTAADDFMRAYLAETAPHPFTHAFRIWRACVVFEVTKLGRAAWGSDVSLSFIQALDKGKGDGSRALDWFLDLARTHGAIVTGVVVRKGTAGLTQRELRAWYKRHGFHVSREGELTFTP